MPTRAAAKPGRRTRPPKPQVAVSGKGKHAEATVGPERTRHYHGDASVAARHTHVKPSHPATGANGTNHASHTKHANNVRHKARSNHAAARTSNSTGSKTSKQNGSARHTTTTPPPEPKQTKTKTQALPGQLPGPYDGAPPPDNGHHGKP